MVIPFLASMPRGLSAQLPECFSAKLAHQLQCYPVGRGGNSLTVAFAVAPSTQTLQYLQTETGYKVFPVLITPEELARRLKTVS